MAQTTNLGLPFLEGSQAQKHVTVNESLRILDAVVQIAVADVDRTLPPASPDAGTRHIVARGASGAWTGHAGAVAAFEDGAWRFVVPNAGWCAWSLADEILFVFDGGTWRDLRDLPVALDNAAHIGINTTAASPNLLSVKSNAALLMAIAAADGGTGDMRVQVSKESAARTASIFFSDNASGRAEFGLTGDDNFHLKVSPDGASWLDALTFERTNGKVSFRGFASPAATRGLMGAAPADAAWGGIQLNGAMEISQENGTNAVVLTASGTLQSRYILDGVKAEYRGSFVASAQQVAAPSGMPAVKALRIAVTTAQASLGANDELSVVLPIEGTRVRGLWWGTAMAGPLSLGFWMSANRPGTYSGAIVNGTKTRSYPFSFAITAANTPQWVSLSDALPGATRASIPGSSAGTWASDVTLGLSVKLCLAGGTARLGTDSIWASADYSGATGSINAVAATTDAIHISGLVVLPGLDLPAGERAAALRTPDQERLLCIGHYEKWTGGTADLIGIGQAQNASHIYAPLYFAAKRAVPTISVSAVSDFGWQDGFIRTAGDVVDGTTLSGDPVNRAILHVQSNAGAFVQRAAYEVVVVGTSGQIRFDARL